MKKTQAMTPARFFQNLPLHKARLEKSLLKSCGTGVF
jgi:hypothetical protein